MHIGSAGNVPFVPQPITSGKPDSSSASSNVNSAAAAAQSAAEPDFDGQVDAIVAAAQALADGVEGSSYTGDEGLEQKCFALITSLNEKAGPIQLDSLRRLTEGFGKIVDNRKTPSETREQLVSLMSDLIRPQAIGLSFTPGPGLTNYPLQLNQFLQELDGREFVAAAAAKAAFDAGAESYSPKDPKVRFELAEIRMQEHVNGNTPSGQLLKEIYKFEAAETEADKQLIYGDLRKQISDDSKAMASTGFHRDPVFNRPAFQADDTMNEAMANLKINAMNRLIGELTRQVKV